MYVRVCMCMCVYLCVFVCLGVCSVVHGCCSRCCSRYCSRLLDRERCECDDVTGSRGERGMIACASGQCIGGGVRGGGGDELSERAVCLRGDGVSDFLLLPRRSATGSAVAAERKVVFRSSATYCWWHCSAAVG